MEAAFANPCYEKRGEFASRTFGAETVLVPVSAGTADIDSIYVMNDVGARIWELVDGHTTILEVAQQIASEFDVTTECATADVREFLSDLLLAGVLCEAPQ